MKSKVLCFVTFALGAAAGAAVSWKILRDKYKQLADEEIESYKEACARRKKKQEVSEDKSEETEDVEEVPVEEEPQEDISVEDAKEKIKELGYKDYSGSKETKKEVKVPVKSGPRPYVIAPMEFAENDDYDTITISYFADGVVAYQDGKVIPPEDVDDLIGEESLEHFGEYEDDTVYVRNDEWRTDFEIVTDVRKYSDVRRTVRPPRMED